MKKVSQNYFETIFRYIRNTFINTLKESKASLYKLFQDDDLEVIEVNSNPLMVGDNDNFVSDIRVWNAKVKLEDGSEKDVTNRKYFNAYL